MKIDGGKNNELLKEDIIIDDALIVESDNIKYLGVTCDSELKFKKHLLTPAGPIKAVTRNPKLALELL